MFLWLSALLSLYVSGFACATTEPLPPDDETPAPHIALLLPLKSATFGTAADAVRQGFQAAASLDMHLPGTLPVRVYGSFDESKDIVTLYRQAIASGARAVAGPLTRDGVSALAAENEIPVPTLALNVVDISPAELLYFFGMAVEAEARQAAYLARQEGLRHAIVVARNTSLSRRIQFAFEEEWQRSGGDLLREIDYNHDPAVFADIIEEPELAVFFAVDTRTAQQVRPYLPNKLPIFATSQIFTGNDNTLANYDLNGIRFVDMPWLLQADHPAVMIYPRAMPPLPADNERLYALGIDAYRLIQLLFAGKVSPAMTLDGVSGQIELYRHVFQRNAIPAVLTQGQARLLNGHDAISPPSPDQADRP